MIQSSLRFLPPLVILGFTATFLLLTFQIPAAARSGPFIIASVTLVLAFLDFITRLHHPVGNLLMRMLNPAGLIEEEKAVTAEEVRRTVSAMGLMALLTVALVFFGVLPASVMFIAGTFIFGGSSRRLALAVAAIFTFLLWLAFAGLLDLTLFEGLLFGGFF